MAQLNSSSRYLIAVCTAATLGSCAPPSPTDPVLPDTTEADAAAIQQVIAERQQRFNTGDLDAFMPLFANDAIIMAPSAPDVVGFDAIRAMYSEALAQVDMKVAFSTEEVEVFGDLAYERGAYTLQVLDRTDGQVTQEIENRHIHIFRRQADGSWKTWRMMVNAATPTPP